MLGITLAKNAFEIEKSIHHRSFILFIFVQAWVKRFSKIDCVFLNSIYGSDCSFSYFRLVNSGDKRIFTVYQSPVFIFYSHREHEVLDVIFK